MRLAAAPLILLAACGRPEAGTRPPCAHDADFDRSSFVRVRADAVPAVVRRDLDLAAIAAESGGTAGAGKPQGLTAIENRLEFHTQANMAKTAEETCVWFDSVSVDLTPASVQIFVPREYPEGSCESLAVLAHEREHERVHREHLAAAAADIRAALEKARWLPARGNPLAVADRAEAEAALNAKIKKVVDPAYAKYKEGLAAAQADLDRPDLYAWVSKRCAGWK